MPPASRSAAVLVFERDPYWAPELQRRFHDTAVTVRPCRRLSDLDAVREEFGEAVLILDFSADAMGCLAWLARRLAKDPLVVLGSPESADLESTLRSLGVTSFQSELIGGADLARLCRRLLQA